MVPLTEKKDAAFPFICVVTLSPSSSHTVILKITSPTAASSGTAAVDRDPLNDGGLFCGGSIDTGSCALADLEGRPLSLTDKTRSNDSEPLGWSVRFLVSVIIPDWESIANTLDADSFVSVREELLNAIPEGRIFLI